MHNCSFQNKFYQYLRDEETGYRKEKQEKEAAPPHTILYRFTTFSGSHSTSFYVFYYFLLFTKEAFITRTFNL